MKILFCIFAALSVSGMALGQSDLPSSIIIDTTENFKTNTFIINKKTITDYSSERTVSWRFVYNDKTLIVEPFYSGGTTFTPYKIMECKTLAIATNEIFKLKLNLTESQLDYIDNLDGGL